MLNVTDRIARYVLRRLRRKAIHDLYRRAEAAGLMESRFIVSGDDQSGQAWSLTAAGVRQLDAAASAGNNAFERALRRGCLPAGADGDEFGDDIDPSTMRSIPKGRLVEEERAAEAATTVADDIDGRPAGRFEWLRAMRRHVAPPSVADAAVALLVARAVGSSVADIPALLDIIRRTSVMIALQVPVGSFERLCALAIERGLILPFEANLVDGVGGQALTGRFRDNPADAHRMTVFSGKHIRKKNDDFGPELLTRALLKPGMPVILIDEASTDLPLRMAAAADLILTSPEIDRALVAELMQVCFGIAPKLSLAAMNKREFDPGNLSIDDLVVALRPGRSAERMIAILQEIEAANDSAADDEDDEAEKSAGRSRQMSKAKKSNETTFEIIQPVKVKAKPDGKAGTTTDRVLLVEDLAGYGAARDWALDLWADLALWREGRLDWSDMGTKLLLSGPPGTGKTTFAKALCNSLQVPMLATSVAQWLEPGYLGDVLKCMSSAFETAGRHKPAILFVDEIDGIGGRSNSARSHAEYWDSVVNRALELLDGVGKSEGVIVVGATNHPDKIDPALRRSGRLERHIVIPQPDSAALIGILAHHLGDDLARILESRPTTKPETEPAMPGSILSPLGLTTPETDDIPKGSRT